MSRATRPQVRLHARHRLALYDAFFPSNERHPHLDGLWGRTAFRDATRCVTRPSILRGAILGQRVPAGAAVRLLARLGAT